MMDLIERIIGLIASLDLTIGIMGLIASVVLGVAFILLICIIVKLDDIKRVLESIDFSLNPESAKDKDFPRHLQIRLAKRLIKEDGMRDRK